MRPREDGAAGGGAGTCVLAVDVGGSGLRAVRVERDGRRGAVARGAGAAIGPAGIAVDLLVDSVASHGNSRDVDVVVWSQRGLLGLTDPAAVLHELHTALRPARTLLVSDGVASLIGALGHVGPGAVIAAGSGAVAFATDFDQEWSRTDGWGHVLGDRGSGAWIGLEGLRAALRHADAVPGGSAPLWEAGTRAWGVHTTWPRQVLTGDRSHALLAEFAPEVAALAATDRIAAEIVRSAGAALADSLAAAARRVPGAPLAISGNLVRSGPIRAAFEAAARDRSLVVRPAVGSALDGAVLLAQHVGRGERVGEHSPYVQSCGAGDLRAGGPDLL